MIKELAFVLITGTIALAWGSLVFRRYQGVVAVEQQTGATFASIAGTLFNA